MLIPLKLIIKNMDLYCVPIWIKNLCDGFFMILLIAGGVSILIGLLFLIWKRRVSTGTIFLKAGVEQIILSILFITVSMIFVTTLSDANIEESLQKEFTDQKVTIIRDDDFNYGKGTVIDEKWNDYEYEVDYENDTITIHQKYNKGEIGYE